MALRNREYGKPRICEHPSCDRQRGAPDRVLMSLGCVLCANHENQYQDGRISLPASADDRRKVEAETRVLGQ